MKMDEMVGKRSKTKSFEAVRPSTGKITLSTVSDISDSFFIESSDQKIFQPLSPSPSPSFIDLEGERGDNYRVFYIPSLNLGD